MPSKFSFTSSCVLPDINKGIKKQRVSQIPSYSSLNKEFVILPPIKQPVYFSFINTSNSSLFTRKRAGNSID